MLDQLVRYPGSWVWPLAAGAGVLVLLVVWVVARRGESPLRWTLAGSLLAAVPLVVGPLAVQGLWLVLVAVRPDYASMLDPWRPGPYRLAAVALVAAVTLLWYALLRRRIGPTSLAVGGLVWLAVLAGVLAAYAPGGSYLAVWPALAGGVAGLVAALTANRAVRAAVALAAGAVAVVVLAPTVSLFFPALGLSSGAAPAFVAAMLSVALLPAFELLFPDPDAVPTAGSRVTAAVVPVVALVTAAACTVAGLLVDTFDAKHPVPSQLVYALDADTGQAWWASTEADPGEYTSRYVDDRGELPVDFPYLTGREVATGPAQVADLPAPAVDAITEREAGDLHEYAFTVTPQRAGVRLLTVEVTVPDGTVVRARAGGRAVPDEALGEDRLTITFHAPPADGLQVQVSVEGGGPATVRVIDGSDGLDGLPGFEPRPEGVDAAGSHSSDLVVVSASVPLG